MKNFTIINFLTSALSVAKSKGYIVTLMFLMTFGFNATAQNGNYTLDQSDDAPILVDRTQFGSNESKRLSPFTTHRNSKVQYIYYATEFQAAPNGVAIGGSGTPQTIRSMAFNVLSMPNFPVLRTFTNMQIRIGNYSGTGFSATTSTPFGEQWTAVSPNDRVTGTAFTMDVPAFQITSMGWFTFELIDNITNGGFVWDGTSNIIVEISHTTPIGQANDWWQDNSDRHFEVEGARYLGDTHRKSVMAKTYLKGTLTGVLGKDMIQGGANHNINKTPENAILETVANRKFRPNVRFKTDCSPLHNLPHNAVIAGAVLPANNGCAQVLLKVTNGNRGFGVEYSWESSPTSDFSANVVVLPNSNQEEYTVVTSNVGMYYRRKQICNSLTKLSESVLVSAAPPNSYENGVWSAGPPDEFSGENLLIVDGNPSISASAKVCGCEIAAGANMIIDSGITLTIANGLKVNGSLTLNDGASLIQLKADATNVGNIKVKRTTQPMVVYDYTYYGSPVQDATLGSFSPNTLSDKYFKWNIDSNLSVAPNWVAVPKTSIMLPGQGYIIRAPQGWNSNPQAFNGEFAGKPNNGSITGIIRTGSATMNMVVNPYPSPLDLNKFQTTNASQLDGTYYFWTHNTPINSTTLQYAQNDFAMYNGTGGTIAASGGPKPNGVVAVGQGFMVKGTGTTVANSTVLYNNEMRLPAAPTEQFFRTNSNVEVDVNSIAKSRLWLNFTGSAAFKQILVGYVDGASAAYDNGFDGEISTDPAVSFYSTLDNYQLGIQGKGLPFSSNDVVSIGFKVNSAGTYKIELADYDGIFSSQAVYLKDNLKNITHNLKEGAYEFITVPGVHNERFEITYVALAPQLAIVNNGITQSSNDFISFRKDNNLIVDAGIAEIEMVQVYDLTGRMIAQQKGLNASELVIVSPNWSSQIVIVQMHTADKSVLTKKVVF